MDGSLQEVMYAWPDSSQHRDQPIIQSSKRDLATDEVTYINGMHCSSLCTIIIYSPYLQTPLDCTGSRTPATLTQQYPYTCTVLPLLSATHMNNVQVVPTPVMSLSSPKMEVCAQTIQHAVPPVNISYASTEPYI